MYKFKFAYSTTKGISCMSKVRLSVSWLKPKVSPQVITLEVIFAQQIT